MIWNQNQIMILILKSWLFWLLMSRMSIIELVNNEFRIKLFCASFQKGRPIPAVSSTVNINNIVGMKIVN